MAIDESPSSFFAPAHATKLKGAPPNEAFSAVGVEAFTLALAPDLAQQLLIDDAGGSGDSAGTLTLRRIHEVRLEIARELGMVIPGVHLRDDIYLKASHYAIFVRDRVVAKGNVEISRVLLLGKEPILEAFEGTACREPVYNLNAKWIDPAELQAARDLGGMVFDPLSVMASHLGDVARRKMADVLTLDAIAGLIDHVRELQPTLIAELTKQVSLYTTYRVYKALFSERVWPRDTVTTLESILEASFETNDAILLAEAARKKLVPNYLLRKRGNRNELIKNTSSTLHIAKCAQSLEDSIATALQGRHSLLDTDLGQKIRKLVSAFSKSQVNREVVLVCSSKHRRTIAELFIHSRFDVSVYAKDEIPSEIVLKTLGEIELGPERPPL